MPVSINSVVLVGNLTRDPELRHTQGGTPVCQFSLAINGSEKVGEEWVERPDFFDVTVFGNQAEACAEYLAKGKKAGVSGRLRQDRWDDKDTGAKRSKVVVIARDVQFLSGTEEGGSSDHYTPTTDDVQF